MKLKWVQHWIGFFVAGANNLLTLCALEDFLGAPSTGKGTMSRGETMMVGRDGKIVLERSICDAVPVLKQLGTIAA